jgi:hypothetical protein
MESLREQLQSCLGLSNHEAILDTLVANRVSSLADLSGYNVEDLTAQNGLNVSREDATILLARCAEL